MCAGMSSTSRARQVTPSTLGERSLEVGHVISGTVAKSVKPRPRHQRSSPRAPDRVSTMYGCPSPSMRAASMATASTSGLMVSPMIRFSGLAATALIAAAAPERRWYQPPGHDVLTVPIMSASARVASSASVISAVLPTLGDDGGMRVELTTDQSREQGGEGDLLVVAD